jgi:hypothetical protein
VKKTKSDTDDSANVSGKKRARSESRDTENIEEDIQLKKGRIEETTVLSYLNFWRIVWLTQRKEAFKRQREE